MSEQRKVSVSIVSHGQGSIVKNLLADLDNCCPSILEVILTINVNEGLQFDVAKFGLPIRIVTNNVPKGFGANHNAAFGVAKADYFCVLNPDVRLDHDPFPCLLEQLDDPTVGVAGPLIVDAAGHMEDSARKYPTPASILKKILFGTGCPDYPVGDAPVFADWIAGMFMVFRVDIFRVIGGFDERYFLYYEDVDLCWRLQHRGYHAVLLPSVRATHHARRQSHHNFWYLTRHIKSMVRFFFRRQWQRNEELR